MTSILHWWRKTGRRTDPKATTPYIATRLVRRGVGTAAATPHPDTVYFTGSRTPIDYLLTSIVESLGRALREE